MVTQNSSVDINKKLIYASFSSKALELIIFPTEQCNFRCVYCYEDFSIGKMSRDIVSGIKALLARRATELRVLQLSFFGGEPLMAADIVEELCDTARSLAERSPDLRYSASATTNGALLTRARFERFHELGLRHYQISLDGYGAVHDATRRRANGNGTFDQIWKNLKAISRSDRDGSIMLRIHLLPHNIPSVLELLDQIQCDLADPRFKLFFKPVGHWGGPNDGQFDILKASSAEFEAAMHVIKARLVGMSNPVIENGPDAAGLPEICYASRANSLGIRADGRIAKCTVALNDPRNAIGQILPDGRLEIDREKLAPWLRGFEGFDLATLGCPLAGLPALPGAQRRAEAAE